MKTELTTKLYAMVFSAAFALMTTAGVALVMTHNGDHVWTQATAAAASHSVASSASGSAPAPALTEWKASTVTTRQVM